MGFREARIKAGLTVQQVMQVMNVSDAAVYQWETGVNLPNGKRLPKLAKLYNCTIDELLSSSKEKKI